MAGARIAVHPRRQPHLELPLPVDPGETVIRVEAPEHEPTERVVAVDAGESVTLRFSLEPIRDATPSETPVRGRRALLAATFVTLGLAVLSGAVTAALGVLTLQRNDEAWSACGEEPCPPAHFDLLEQGESFQLWTNVMIGVTTVCAVGALVLSIVTFRRVRTSPDASSRQRWSMGAGGSPSLDFRASAILGAP